MAPRRYNTLGHRVREPNEASHGERDFIDVRVVGARYLEGRAINPKKPTRIVGAASDVITFSDFAHMRQTTRIIDVERISFAELGTHAELHRTVWLDPYSLDPSANAMPCGVKGMLCDVTWVSSL